MFQVVYSSTYLKYIKSKILPPKTEIISKFFKKREPPLFRDGSVHKQERRGQPKGRPRRIGYFRFYSPTQRYRKVTVCPRVQFRSGLKVVAEVP